MLTELTKNITEFEKLQNQYASFGARDTEPDGVFQYLLWDAFKEKAYTIPEDTQGWQLYSSVPGGLAVAQKLSESARKCIDCVLKAKAEKVKGLKGYLKDYCWRV